MAIETNLPHVGALPLWFCFRGGVKKAVIVDVRETYPVAGLQKLC